MSGEVHKQGILSILKQIYLGVDWIYKMIRRYPVMSILLTIVLYSSYLHYMHQNPNPLRPIENAEPFIWSKSCSKKAFDAAVLYAKQNLGYARIPCACANPKYEIKDWYKRGLAPYGKSSWSSYYYRIGNDAVGINFKGKWTGYPTCFAENADDDFSKYGKKFFKLSNGAE